MYRSAALALAAALTALPAASATYRGIEVAPERRCAPYDRDAYRYPQSVEDRIIERLGGIHGPYTGRCFASKRETDIQHMVAGLGGARQRHVRPQRRREARIRQRPRQPDPCRPLGEPPPEARQGRRGVVAGAQHLLVRRHHPRGAPQIRADHRRAGVRRHSISAHFSKETVASVGGPGRVSDDMRKRRLHDRVRRMGPSTTPRAGHPAPTGRVGGARRLGNDPSYPAANHWQDSARRHPKKADRKSGIRAGQTDQNVVKSIS